MMKSTIKGVVAKVGDDYNRRAARGARRIIAFFAAILFAALIAIAAPKAATSESAAATEAAAAANLVVPATHFSTPRRKAGGGVKARKRFRGVASAKRHPPRLCLRQTRTPPLATQAGGKKPVIPAKPVISAKPVIFAKPVISAAPLVIPAQAGIQTRPQVRTADNAAFGGNDGILNSALRANDGILSGDFRWNEAIADIGGGLSFADYARREQLRLFDALDNALSQSAQGALLGEFAAVKKADVQLQTKLGGRKGNIGVNLIGAIAEADSRAIGWQLRTFIAQESGMGFNAGVFHRTIDSDKGTLWGANAFWDYERGDYGGFSRFGIGGEIKHSIVGFVANYYLPITDEQFVRNGDNGERIAAFSRRGYDAKLRLNAPDIDRLKLAVDYYHFDGKGGTKADKGFRYGVEFIPVPALHVGLFHDSEGDKFGGDIAYAHSIGKVQGRQSNSSSFLQKQESPDLFAPVSREYSQRIALVTITNAPPLAAGSFGYRFLVNATVTLATLSTGYGGLLPDVDYRFSVTANSDRHFFLAGNTLRFEWFARHRFTLTRTLDNGVLDLDIRTEGAPRTLTTLEATVVASDTENPARPAGTLFFRVTAVPAVVAGAEYLQRGFVAGSGDSLMLSVANITLAGGQPPYFYTVMQPSGQNIFQQSGNAVVAAVNAGDGLPAVFPASVRTWFATVQVSDSSTLTSPVSVAVDVNAAAPVSISIEYNKATPYTTGQNYGGFAEHNGIDRMVSFHTFGGRPVSGQGRVGDGYHIRWDFRFSGQHNHNTGTNSANGSGNFFNTTNRPIRAAGSFSGLWFGSIGDGLASVIVRIDDDSDVGNIDDSPGSDLTPPVQATAILTVVAP